jgi:hypothetical protein
MDGELSRRNVRRDRRERHNQYERRESDQQIGKDELVTQAPQQMLVYQSPGQRDSQANKRKPNQKLHQAEQCTPAAGRQAQKP